MICPNLRIAAPSSTGTTAILWPFGMRCRAATPPDGSAPAEMSSIAMMTLSEGSRRRARGVVMTVVFWLRGLSYGEKSSGCRLARSSSRAAVILRCCFMASHAAVGSSASIAAAIAECSFRLARSCSDDNIVSLRVLSRWTRRDSSTSADRAIPKLVVNIWWNATSSP